MKSAICFDNLEIGSYSFSALQNRAKSSNVALYISSAFKYGGGARHKHLGAGITHLGKVFPAHVAIDFDFELITI